MGDVGAHQYQRLVVDLKELHKCERPAEVDWVERVPDSVRVSPLPRQVHTSIDEVVGNLCPLE